MENYLLSLNIQNIIPLGDLGECSHRKILKITSFEINYSEGKDCSVRVTDCLKAKIIRRSPALAPPSCYAYMLTQYYK